jgi:hypothetical protein
MTSTLPRAATACRWDGVRRSSFFVAGDSMLAEF